MLYFLSSRAIIIDLRNRREYVFDSYYFKLLRESPSDIRLLANSSGPARRRFYDFMKGISRTRQVGLLKTLGF
jgi:hypothetical protein